MIVAYNRDDLVWILGIERNQRAVIYTIDMREVSGLFFGNPSK